MTPHLRHMLQRLARGKKPIVVGPWTSEIGYELLYWIPFVAWAINHAHLDPARLVVVSRGGCGAWYSHIAARYLDVFSWITPDAFRAAAQARVLAGTSRRTQKQLTVDGFDTQILDHVRREIGPCEMLHPSVMYQLFRQIKPWQPDWQRYASHRRFATVRRLEGLPAQYVAVRCYASSICPDAPELRERLLDRVRDLLLDGDVVLLNTGEQYDDHREIDFPGLVHPRLHRIADRLTSATNLEVQTRVIAGASKVFGTYGGYSYLPPLLGVNTETVYTDAKALARLDRHLTVARGVFRRDPACGWLSLTPLDHAGEEYDVA